MSAILSVDDLNDFISPGVACIKPVETLSTRSTKSENVTSHFEVTTEEQLAMSARVQDNSSTQDAQISLTDCLACSGCVTSAEAVLISLQSHEEVLNTLGSHPELAWQDAADDRVPGKIFVASVSPQTRASIAATFQVTEPEAGHMIEQLLRGPHGLKSGGKHKSGFTWVLDTNTARGLCLRAGIQEALQTIESEQSTLDHDIPSKPVLASSCPGWICYAEKTHPHVLPHLSRLKSPQAITGTMIKSVLSRKFGVAANRVWHVAVMPCFDKKLEASRQELTDAWWNPESRKGESVRDVDCVITAKELIMLAESRGVSMHNLPRLPVESPQPRFPDPILDKFLFSRDTRHLLHQQQGQGSSGGYAYHVLLALQTQHSGSEIRTVRGRNVDVVEYVLVCDDRILAKTARYYGFRNIQNLVRALKPAKASRLPGSRQKFTGTRAGNVQDFAYVEVMACPGGCTNGGGQIKASDLPSVKRSSVLGQETGPMEQKQWLALIDEAYFSAENSDQEDEDPRKGLFVDAGMYKRNRSEALPPGDHLQGVLQHWSHITSIPIEDLTLTRYQAIENNVGGSGEQIAASASVIDSDVTAACRSGGFTDPSVRTQLLDAKELQSAVRQTLSETWLQRYGSFHWLELSTRSGFSRKLLGASPLIAQRKLQNLEVNISPPAEVDYMAIVRFEAAHNPMLKETAVRTQYKEIASAYRKDSASNRAELLVWSKPPMTWPVGIKNGLV